MFKALLILAFTMFATTLMAAPIPTCSCTQTFEDYLGAETEITVHVSCPPIADAAFACGSVINNNTFAASCLAVGTGEENKSVVSLPPGSHPSYGYTYCRLN